MIDAAYEDMKRIFVDNFKGNSQYESCKISYPDEVIDVQRIYNVPAAYHGLKNLPDFNLDERFSGSILNDAFQRDITFNSLYYDLKTSDIIDFVGGMHALRDGIIDFSVDVDAHLREVPRVVLRILRFKARYGFKFADKIEKVMRENAMKYMKLLTPDSVSFQFASMFAKDYGLASDKLLNDYGVFTYLFPSLKDIAETEEYKKYAEKTMKFIEAQKSQDIKNLWLALLLWPAVNKYDADTVLEAQGKIYKFKDGEVDALKKFFELGNEMANIALMMNLSAKGEFFIT